MGQCSTLPSPENGGNNNSGTNLSPKYQQHVSSAGVTAQYYQPYQQRDDAHLMARHDERRNGNNGGHGPEVMEESSEDSKTPLTSGMDKQSTANMTSFLNVVRKSVGAFDPFPNESGFCGDGERNGMNHGNSPIVTNERRGDRSYHQQGHGGDNRAGDNRAGYHAPHAVNTKFVPPPSSHRRRAKSEDSVSSGMKKPVPLPPDSAARMRCYRLNLDVPPDVLHPASHGPMEIMPRLRGNSWEGPTPGLTYSVSEDSSTASATAVAVSTAKIFRGLTITKDGSVTSRKMRGSAKSKPDEKSRQAAKIDKAKELVEAAGKNKSSPGDDSNMMSLVIMGEYDDMKYLVKDGSKKLKEAQGLSDETLLAINRSRPWDSPSHKSPMASIPPQLRDSKRRHSGTNNFSPNRLKHKLPQQSPPKLKGHPRDIPRRSSNSKGRFATVQDQCHDMPIFGGEGGVWSEAIGFSKGFNSIWNCGATRENSGTMSPDPTSVKNRKYKEGGPSTGEGRDDSWKANKHDSGSKTGRDGREAVPGKGRGRDGGIEPVRG